LIRGDSRGEVSRREKSVGQPFGLVGKGVVGKEELAEACAGLFGELKTVHLRLGSDVVDDLIVFVSIVLLSVTIRQRV